MAGMDKKSYLLANNRMLDFVLLNERMDLILADHEQLPASHLDLPSQHPQRLVVLRHLLIKAKSGSLAREWLPRYPRLYRLVRSTYQLAKRFLGLGR